jgi:hypothetical protein
MYGEGFVQGLDAHGVMESSRFDNFWHNSRTRHEHDTKIQGLSLALSGSSHNRVNLIMTHL